jgi:hypothetical protein
LKLKRGTKCGAIEYFEWKLLPNIKKMHNVSSLGIFLDVGARKCNS